MPAAFYIQQIVCFVVW